MTENNGKLAPAVRFAGFTDDWTQRKLGDMASATFGGGTPATTNENYWLGNIPWIQSSDIIEHEISYVNLRKSITDEGLKNSATKLVPANSIAVVTRVGVGKLSVIPFDYATSQDFLSLSDLNVDVWYGAYSLYRKLQKEIHSVQGTSIKGITKDELLSKVINSPSAMAEQTAIGAFFRSLDNAIHSHQQKLNHLRELKKGYLQQMFPQERESVPRVRFAGFDGDWTAVTLGDIAERVTRKNTLLESTLPLTISAQYGLIDQNEFFDKQIASRDVSGYFLVKKGEFAYNKSYSNGYPWGAVKRLDRYDMGVLSVLYIVFKPTTIDSEFLLQYYETDNWHTEIVKYAAEGARNHGLLNIAPNDFFKTILTVPQSEKEQSAIGNFFRTVDNQISMQSQKLEQLKQLKAAYLQKMFV